MNHQDTETAIHRKAVTEHAVHELLQRRFSPYAFDPARSVSDDDLKCLFEAARWTMSSFNAQPWRYVLGIRERNETLWQQVLDVLLPGNQTWAQHVPVLALGIVEHKFEHNGKNNKAAVHDLGAASANLTVEATARGLSVHQMIGIDPEKAREVFSLPESMEAVTALAIGYAGRNDDLDPDIAKRDERPRQRKSLEELLLYGTP